MYRLLGRHYKNGRWVYIYQAGDGSIKEITQQDFDEQCRALAAERLEIELEDPDFFPTIAPEDFQSLQRGCGRLPSPVSGLEQNWIEAMAVSRSNGISLHIFRKHRKKLSQDIPGIFQAADRPEGRNSGFRFDRGRGSSDHRAYSQGRSYYQSVSGQGGRHQGAAAIVVPKVRKINEVFKERLSSNDQVLVEGRLANGLSGFERDMFLFAMGVDVDDVPLGIPRAFTKYRPGIGRIITALHAINKADKLDEFSLGGAITGTDYENNRYLREAWYYHSRTAVSCFPWLTHKQYIMAKLVHFFMDRSALTSTDNRNVKQVFSGDFELKIATLDVGAQSMGQVLLWFHNSPAAQSRNLRYLFQSHGDDLVKFLKTYMEHREKLIQAYSKALDSLPAYEITPIFDWIKEPEKETLSYLLDVEIPKSSAYTTRGGNQRLPDISGLTVGKLFSALYVTTGSSVIVAELANLHPLFADISSALFGRRALGDSRTIHSIPIEVTNGNYLFDKKMLVYLAHKHRAQSTAAAPYLLTTTRQYMDTVPDDAIYTESWLQTLVKLQARLASDFSARRRSVFLDSRVTGETCIKLPFLKWAQSYEPVPSFMKCNNILCPSPDTNQKPSFLYQVLNKQRRYCPRCPLPDMAPVFESDVLQNIADSIEESGVESDHEHRLRQITAWDLRLECTVENGSHQGKFNCSMCKQKIKYSIGNDAVPILMYSCDYCLDTSDTRNQSATGFFRCKKCQSRHCLKHHGNDHKVIRAGQLIEQFPEYSGGIRCDQCEQLITCSATTTEDSLTLEKLKVFVLHCSSCNQDFCASCSPEAAAALNEDGEEAQGQSLPEQPHTM